ncbi:MAG: nucleoside 5-triphosphatase RdgB [Chitinophagaceae bacterium]|nr:nucleoside 5-triphosphatase RdgB [Chitinophagaceae bacterium]
MKTVLVFATNNQHKVDEIKFVIGTRFEIITMKEAGIDMDIPEPHDTLQANALEKAKAIHQLLHQNCFSEDSGLEVTELKGEPGVLSARYAGDEKSPAKNVEKLLENLKGKADRSARFRTVISLILDDKEFSFEGVCEGTITDEPRGHEGFGYDPVFVPDGSNKTFAEMTMKEKTLYSHRRKATDQFILFLQSYGKN